MDAGFENVVVVDYLDVGFVNEVGYVFPSHEQVVVHRNADHEQVVVHRNADPEKVAVHRNADPEKFVDHKMLEPEKFVDAANAHCIPFVGESYQNYCNHASS